MAFSRRRLLAAVLGFTGLAAGAVPTGRSRQTLAAPPSSDLGPDRFRKALSLELRGAQVVDSSEITLEVPAIAEDGAVVPIRLESRIPATDRLVLFVERNPFPLIAAFQFRGAARPWVATRIKINESSTVVLLARAGGQYYRTAQWVRVVRGGCG